MMFLSYKFQVSLIFGLIFVVNVTYQDDLSCPKDGCTVWLDKELQNLNQNDEALIAAIRKDFLTRPPMIGNKPVNMTVGMDIPPYIYGQYGQPLIIDEIFHGANGILNDGGSRQRFFVEAGAFDGVSLSNTMYLEAKRNWTGLLVEPNPREFKRMEMTNRNAWLLNGCFATQDKPQIVKFDAAGLLGGIENTAEPGRPKPGGDSHIPGRETIDAQCLPLYSIIKALDSPIIDYMSLDVEGSEFQILKTIPWEEVNITVLGIEVNHVGTIFPGSLDSLREFLFEKGYILYQKVSIDEMYIRINEIKRVRELKAKKN